MIRKYEKYPSLSNYQETLNHFLRNQSSLEITFSQLRQIDVVSSQLRNVFSINFDHCRLSNLQGMQQFNRLQEFSCRYNYLDKCRQFGSLSNKKLILKLNVFGNPFQQNQTQIHNYFKKIFPNISRINQKPLHTPSPLPLYEQELPKEYKKTSLIPRKHPTISAHREQFHKPNVQQPKTACFNQQKTTRYINDGKQYRQSENQTIRFPFKKQMSYRQSYSIDEIQNRSFNNTSRISCYIEQVNKDIHDLAIRFDRYKLFDKVRRGCLGIRKEVQQIEQNKEQQQYSGQQQMYITLNN